MLSNFKIQFPELTDVDFGKEMPLEEGDKQLIELYNQGYSKLTDEERLLAFRNVIRNHGNCGFANSGYRNYLINTDPHSRYRVTIRTYWRSGINQGQYDRVYIMNAGSRKYLGCTNSGNIPVAYYRRLVVGEERI